MEPHNDDINLKYERIDTYAIKCSGNQNERDELSFTKSLTGQMTSDLKQLTQQQHLQLRHPQTQQQQQYVQPVKRYRFEGNVYHDCSYSDVKTVVHTLNINITSRRKGPRGGVAVPFPVRLHAMLEHHNQERKYDHHDSSDDRKLVVCWQPHGRSFRINDVKQFVLSVMPRYAELFLKLVV
jgi:transcription initiation factor TFIID subunit TAF12